MSAVEHVSGIPVVDFGAMSLEHDIRPNTDSQAVQTLSKQIYSAFSTIGFVYLKNHGIHQQKVGFSFNAPYVTLHDEVLVRRNTPAT